MTSRPAICVVAVAFAAVSLGVASGAHAADPSAVRFYHIAHAGDEDSLNWAGYIDTPRTGRVTAVHGSFAVPAVSSPVPPGLTSTWVGIGGSTTGDLIQAGVEEDTAATPVTGPAFRAWYELLPDSQTPLTGCVRDSSCNVRPGDHMDVDIHRVSANRWLITITDSRHWRWQHAVSYLSSGSSAEWISEATSVIAVPALYANVATVAFDHGTFQVTGIGVRNIRAGQPTLTAIRPGGGPIAEAIPSALARDGDGFNICAYNASCPAPR